MSSWFLQWYRSQISDYFLNTGVCISDALYSFWQVSSYWSRTWFLYLCGFFILSLIQLTKKLAIFLRLQYIMRFFFHHSHQMTLPNIIIFADTKTQTKIILCTYVLLLYLILPVNLVFFIVVCCEYSINHLFILFISF